MIRIRPSGQACGAEVTGVDLTGELDAKTVAALRAAWLEHLVLAFPGQALTDGDLERFTPCWPSCMRGRRNRSSYTATAGGRARW